MLTRTRFNRPPLVRCLEGLGLSAAPECGQTLADRLGPWLDWRDAIALFEALQGGEAPAPAAAAPAGLCAQALREDLARVRAELSRDIAEDSVFTEAGVDAATCRAHHAAHQRAMEARVGALRDRVREALTTASPELARLAALDALMERALAVRERQLLANVPVLLEQQASRERELPGSTTAVESRQGRASPPALQAELTMRLDMVEGLLDALAPVPSGLRRDPAASPP